MRRDWEEPVAAPPAGRGHDGRFAAAQAWLAGRRLLHGRRCPVGQSAAAVAGRAGARLPQRALAVVSEQAPSQRALTLHGEPAPRQLGAEPADRLGVLAPGGHIQLDKAEEQLGVRDLLEHLVERLRLVLPRAPVALPDLEGA